MTANSTIMVLPPNQNRAPALLAVGWIEAVLALGFVSARMYCRGVLLHNIGRDDWTMLFSFFLAVVATIFITVYVSLGVGRHIVYLQPDQVTMALKALTISEPFSTFSTCFGKISIAFLLMRIMNRNKLQEALLWIVIVSLVLVNIACMIVNFAGCEPVWGPHPNPNCWSPQIQLDVSYAQGAHSSFTDLFLAIFPYFIIRNLQMERRLKIGLICLLSLGFFAAACSTVKTIELRNLQSTDFTWDVSDLVFWITTEQYVIIIAACIPTLRPLFKQHQYRPTISLPRSTDSGQRHGQYGPTTALQPRHKDSPVSSMDQIPLSSTISYPPPAFNSFHAV